MVKKREPQTIRMDIILALLTALFALTISSALAAVAIGWAILSKLKNIAHETETKLKKVDALDTDVRIACEAIKSMELKIDSRIDNMLNAKKSYDENRFLSLKEALKPVKADERSRSQ